MSTASPPRLSTELEFYEKHKAGWLQSNRDEYIVIKGNDVLGFYVDFHQAYLAGVAEYGINTDFLVKRIVPHEPVFVIF